jgi:hypothetical protein
MAEPAAGVCSTGEAVLVQLLEDKAEGWPRELQQLA